MTDTELNALTAIVAMQREMCAADNEQRARNNYAPAWTSDCLPSDEERALRDELIRRGVLPPNAVIGRAQSDSQTFPCSPTP